MHSIREDGGVIWIKGEGFYVEDEVRRHFEALSLVIARRRRSGGPVKALADLRGAATQAASTAKIITDETNRLYSDPSDRVAIVVASVLLKLQLERVHRQQGFRVFLSVAEAEEHLAAAADGADR